MQPPFPAPVFPDSSPLWQDSGREVQCRLGIQGSHLPCGWEISHHARHNVSRAVKSALGWDVLSCLVSPWGLRKPLSSKAQSVFLRVGEGEGLSRGLEAMWEF